MNIAAYKHISAHLNSKGELYFTTESNEEYKEAKVSSEFNPSVEMFRPFDKEQELRIIDALGSSFVKSNNSDFKSWMKEGVDVSDFVEIRVPDQREGCSFSDEYFAFYKPKDQPEQTEGESQEEMWDDIIGEIGKPVGLSVLSRLKSKYIIKRR